MNTHIFNGAGVVMKVLLHGCFRTVLCALMATGACSDLAKAAMDPQFELDPQTLESTAANRAEKRKGKRPVRQVEKKRSRATGASMYTVKPGDHIFKILMRDYGLSNDQAEALIDEICRENGIRDIRRLQVGQKLKIPAAGRTTTPATEQTQASEDVRQRQVASGDDVAQTLRLEPDQSASVQAVDPAARLRDSWDQIIPSGPELMKPLVVQSPNFSLSLDSKRYPVFATLDGARIVVDQQGTIPPLVRSLITDKDPGIRIVSGSTDNRQFLADMLKSAGFYSVEEDFLLTLGKDPKISVVSDFKVEKKPESLVQQDVVLVNASRDPFPSGLSSLLKKEGFTVHEPFAGRRIPVVPPGKGEIHRITGSSQSQIVDALLKALAVRGETDRKLDVFASENNGISLAVSAERYFERNGKRYVVTRFDGDPINYTLFRILETRGYQVVILEQQDSFRKIAEKILSRLNLRGSFAQHALWPAREENFSVQLSGFKVEGATPSGGSLFLTDVELDRVVRDILGEKGFQVNDGR